jgi:UDP-glucose 4-epimerase
MKEIAAGIRPGTAALFLLVRKVTAHSLEEHSVKEVIAIAERVSGRRIRVNITPRRVGDPAVLIGAFDRAQATLGWEPARSDLQIQIRDAWNWMRVAARPAKAQ